MRDYPEALGNLGLVCLAWHRLKLYLAVLIAPSSEPEPVVEQELPTLRSIPQRPLF